MFFLFSQVGNTWEELIFEHKAALIDKQSETWNAVREIVQRIPQFLANTRYWFEKKTFPIDEAFLRFHHQLMTMHAFANANGRHARMIVDIVAAKYGQPEFTWGARKDRIAQGDAAAGIWRRSARSMEMTTT